MAFALISIIFSSSYAPAQRVNVPLAQNPQMYFDHIKIGSTECQPIMATNPTSSVLTISNVTFTVGEENFSITDTSVLPLSLKAGESAKLGKLCFTALTPNKEFIGYLSINYSASRHTNDGEIRISATTEIDSSLLIPCFTVSFDSALFGPVFYGGEAFRTMSVTNNNDILKTIRCIDFTFGDMDVFGGIGNQFPMDLSPHETKPIHLFFAPITPSRSGSDNFRSKVKIESMDAFDSCSPDFDIYGSAIQPTDMNVFNPFDRIAILPTLKMSGENEIFGQTFLFQCTDKDSLEVDEILLDDNDPHFILTPTGACSSLPMVAAPGELMAVRISLQTKDPTLYYNKLRFVLGKGMKPIVYDIQAMRIFLQSKVRQGLPAESFAFSAIPNPSSGNITIEIAGDMQADILISDAAGKEITAEKNIRIWTWNGKAKNGVSVPSGNYFIRATSHNPNGKEIVRTEKVAIMR